MVSWLMSIDVLGWRARVVPRQDPGQGRAGPDAIQHCVPAHVQKGCQGWKARRESEPHREDAEINSYSRTYCTPYLRESRQ